jgi:RNA polymerase sigma factor (sigma-70 family)
LSKPRTELSEIPKLLDVLANHERDVLVLRIVHGLGFSDVAAALGISEEAAKKRAQRALKRLRAKVCDSESSRDKLLATL